MRTSGRITSAKRYKIFVSSDKGWCGIDRIEIYFEELSVRKVLCFSVDTESEEAGE